MSDLSNSNDWLDVAIPDTEDDDLSLSFPDPLDKSHFENALETQSSVSQSTDDAFSDVDSIPSTNHSAGYDFAPTQQEQPRPPNVSDLIDSINATHSLSSSSRTITDSSATLSPLKLVILTTSDDLQVHTNTISKSFMKALFGNKPGFVIENNLTSHFVNASEPDCSFPVNDKEWRRTSNYFELHCEYINLNSPPGKAGSSDAITKIFLENLPTIVITPDNDLVGELGFFVKLKTNLALVHLDVHSYESSVDENTITFKELTDHAASPKLNAIYEGISGTRDATNDATITHKEPVSWEHQVKVRPKVSADVSLWYLVWFIKYTCSVLGLVLLSMLALNVYRVATEDGYDMNWLSRLGLPTASNPNITQSRVPHSAPSCSSRPSLILTPPPTIKTALKTIDQAKVTTDLSIFNQVLDVVARIPPMSKCEVKYSPNTTDLSGQPVSDSADWLRIFKDAATNISSVSSQLAVDHIRQLAAMAETILELAYVIAEMGYESARLTYTNAKKRVPVSLQGYGEEANQYYLKTSQQLSHLTRRATTQASHKAALLWQGSAPPRWFTEKRLGERARQWSNAGKELEKAVHGGMSQLNRKTYRAMKQAKISYKRTMSRFV